MILGWKTKPAWVQEYRKREEIRRMDLRIQFEMRAAQFKAGVQFEELEVKRKMKEAFEQKMKEPLV